MIEESLAWEESIVLSNLQPNLEEENQLLQTLPSDSAKALVKIDVHKVEKVAVVQFLEAEAALGSLNYYYQNPAVLGQVQVNPCFLLLNLKDLRKSKGNNQLPNNF